MRRLVSWLAVSGLSFVLLELVVSAYYFQRRGEAPSAIVHYAGHQLQRWNAARRQLLEPVGIWRDDPRFGYVHVPGAEGVHRRASFEVTYRIGPHGERRTPMPDHPLAKVAFVGCSYTFGWGVEDDEAFPSLLATQSWPEFHVVNRAVSGYGTAHALMQLQDLLSGDDRPVAVLYPMIPDHLCRNYVRPGWVRQLAESRRAHPHFEEIDGRPKWMGVVSEVASTLAEHALRQREVDVTAALLTEMQSLSLEANVQFYVLLLPQRYESACHPNDWPFRVMAALKPENTIDLTDLRETLSWLVGDPHPDPAGHRTIARAIAASRVGEYLSTMHAAHAGGADSDPDG